MTSIALTSDQLQQWRAAAGSVELTDQLGNVLGYVASAIPADVLATALEQSKSEGPWHTTDEVLTYLESLDN